MEWETAPAAIAELGVGEAQSLRMSQHCCRRVGCAGKACVKSETDGNLPGAERVLLKGGTGRGLAEGLKVLGYFILS